AFSDPFGTPSSPIADYVCHPSAPSVVTICADGTTRFWRFRSSAPSALAPDSVSIARFSQEGRFVATATSAGTNHFARVWTWEPDDKPARRAIFPPLIHPAEITSFGLSSDARWLATVTSDGPLRVWDIQATNVVMEVRRQIALVKCVAF